MIRQPKLVPSLSHSDERGLFKKICNDIGEEHLYFNSVHLQVFYSLSHKNVIRGFHFQKPPHDAWKIVYCSMGAVIDHCLRIDSMSLEPELYEFVLKEHQINYLVIPPNFAHAFEVISDAAIINYIVSKPSYSSSELTINPMSFPKIWKTQNPIISKKDKNSSMFDTKFWI